MYGLPKTAAMNPQTPETGNTMSAPRVPKETAAKTCVACLESHVVRCRGFIFRMVWQALPFPTREDLPECQHDFDICSICVTKYIRSHISTQRSGAVGSISCPTFKCTHVLTYAEIRRFVSPSEFAEYDQWALMSALRAMPDYMWCVRDGCPAGGFYGGIPPPAPRDAILCPSNHVACFYCNTKMCTICNAPWHVGMTCAESQAMVSAQGAQDKVTAQYLSRNTKQCPGRGCGVRIEKTGGCTHMTCSRCGHQFRWCCLVPWWDGCDIRCGISDR
ncbi:hypothetical protein F5Y10DRAFT_227677 [Nemania abortiva]|nr:hypothetical protein F5Y10DRAFT_227677 [Nemania abortiva]